MAPLTTAPTGHLGNLSPEQTYKLKEMYLAFLINLGYTSEGAVKVGGKAPPAEKKGGHFGFGGHKVTAQESLKEATSAIKTCLAKVKREKIKERLPLFAKTEHLDQVLLRFLRARKWDVVRAAEMYGKTLQWRLNEYDVDEILRKGERYYIDEEPDEGFINQYKQGKSIVRGKDKFGRPIVNITVHKHDPRAQSEQAMERYTLHCIEASHLCLNENQETAAVIFDLYQFGLHNMDYHVVKFILHCFEAHYPESLGFVYIHRAPWVFSTVWQVIKGWIDPVVAAKISFTKGEKDLLQSISSEQLPKSLGGTLAHDYEWIPPSEGDDAPMADTVTRDRLLAERTKMFEKFFDITLKWIAADGPEADKLYKERMALSDELYKDYFRIDPYVRARSIYDRNGTLAQFHEEYAPGGVAQPILK